MPRHDRNRAHMDMDGSSVDAVSGSSTPLELSPAQVRDLLDTTAKHILDFQQALAEGTYPASYVHDSLDVKKYEHGRQVAADLREDQPPVNGTDFHLLLEDLFSRATANGTMHPHPGFMAYIPSGGLFAGAIGDFIARAVNRFAGVWLAAPGFQQIESNVITWFCAMLGYGEGSFGYLTTGGSIANLMALHCARKSRGEPSVEAPILYFSSQAHFSVAKGASIAGIPASNLRVIQTGPDLGMDVDLLIENIKKDRAAGLTPMCVVATAGTTSSGAIDDLERISEVCRAEGLWLHADACFGGFFRITQRGRAALRGIEHADSIAVDAHKSLFLPVGSSALLVKDRTQLRRAFGVHGADYMPDFADELGLVDFCNYGPELSREIRGITAWLPIKMYGLHTFEQCLDEKLDLIEYLAEKLSSIHGLEVIRKHPLHLPIVTFKLPRHDNARLCELVCSRGNVYLTTTELPEDGLVVRVCILHHQTHKAVVDQLLLDIAWAVTELTAADTRPR